ncbi:MAG: CHAP domain-containing protein [Actinomycetota bacterium]|nr:CHAP domain-containing protein [Actinomycetota bacterium]
MTSPTLRTPHRPHRLHPTPHPEARTARLRRHGASLATVLALVLAMVVGPLAWTSAVAITWFNPVCGGFVACNAAGMGNNGYERVYTTSFWGMYPGHNCTNYSAYRLIARGIDASYLRGQGMAYQWGAVAASHGVAVDKSPVVGDIAWFDQTAGLSTSGHVAYVESVDLLAGTIRLSEDNYKGDFDWRSYYIRDVTGFIHFAGGGTTTPPAPPPPVTISEGDFVRVQETGEVDRIAGGAPVYVTSWSAFGGMQPVKNVSAAQLAALPLTPRDGTFIKGTDGVVFRVIGGAPLVVSSWAPFGGTQATVTVDSASILRAGSDGYFRHLLAVPRDGTFVTNTATGTVYRVAGGAPLRVSTWAAFPSGQTTWAADPYEFTHYTHLRATPVDTFIKGSRSGRVYRTVSGRAFYVSSWTPYGGARPYTEVDDWAVGACDHLNCQPLGRLDATTGIPGGAIVSGWAMDPNATAPLSVAFVVDGVPSGTATASVSRPDVDAVYHSGAAVGFQSAVRLSSGIHTVCAQAVDVAPGSASDLGCGTATVVPGSVVSVTPTRLLDTRTGLGAPAVAVAPARTTTVQVTGRGPVPPTGATAVLLNMTVTGATRSGYLTVYPSGRPRPATSNLNYAPGQTTSNLVLVPIDSTGRVTAYNASSGTLQVVADVAGYVVSGATTTPGAVVPVTATRLLDTRTGLGSGRTGALTPTAVTVVPVTGRGPVPSSVGAVWLNVTVTGATRPGYLTAYPSGRPRPSTSNLNYQAGQTTSNLVLVPIDSTGRVTFYNASLGTLHVVADVAGYVVAGTAAASGAVVPVTPTRLLDTRTGLGAVVGAIGPGKITAVRFTGRLPVPTGSVSAVVLNVTAASATASGYLTVFPGGSARPPTSDVSLAPGRTVPNLVVVPVGPDGSVQFFNGSPGSTHVLADVEGYIRR